MKDEHDRDRWRAVGIFAALAGFTGLVYLPSLQGAFVNWDDDKYILLNDAIHSFDLEMVRWAFSSTYMYNWHPLTWLSHALDLAVWGEDPWGHHLTNVVLHVLNTALVGYVFWRGTGRLAASAFVAALFGLHPMHVESVAWIAERKDVLSTFFWLLTMLAYLAFVRKPGAVRYGLVVAFLALGLLSKSMVVTLPCVLLLLDFWPLRRLSRAAVLEKIPLLAMSAAASAVAVLGQKSGGAVASVDLIPLAARLQNAVYSYGRYLAKLAWPDDLVALYPYYSGASGNPGAVPLALLLLLGITVVAYVLRERRPYLLTGWLWYLGTLVPVIGLVQVGQQSIADRYTYVPFIGVFVMLAFTVDALARSGTARRAAAVVGTLLILLWALLASTQIVVWRDSEALWANNLAVYPDHPLLRTKLADALTAKGKTAEAMEQYRDAIDVSPGSVDALVNLANAHYRKGEFEPADRYYRQAIAADPTRSRTHGLLCSSLIQQNRLEQGREVCRRALELDANEVVAWNALGVAFAKENDLTAAMEHWTRALEIDEDSVNAHSLLAKAYARLGRQEEAQHHLNRLAEIEGK